MQENKIDLTEKLPIMEAFYTLQGEGFHSGKAAYFIRLGGCDVGCVWCDVKDSWDANAHPKVAVEELLNNAKEHPGKLIVITGGEPLMYNLDNLTAVLQSENFKTNIETSGAHPLSGSWDWICFSPKKFKEPLPEFYEAAHELKIIVFNKSDFDFAEKHAVKVNKDCILYLQPEWDKREQMMPLIVDYIKENPKWRMSIQTHKYLDIP
jgi:7-carboxy-7-deazaguanine synthase